MFQASFFKRFIWEASRKMQNLGSVTTTPPYHLAFGTNLFGVDISGCFHILTKSWNSG